MSEDKLSWVELKEITPFIFGLEASWTWNLYDGPPDEVSQAKSIAEYHWS
jgi:hypothetical protein